MTRLRGALAAGVVSSLVFAAGCGPASREQAFADVATTVADRQPQRIHWNSGAAEDAAVARQVRGVLAHELAVDDAVQIALLNNRRLQVVYEDLGIAQADLVHAGLLRNPVFDASVRFASGGGVDIGLSVVQNFLDVIFVPLRRRMAEAAIDGAKLRVAGAVIDLAGEVRRTAYAYQTTMQALELRRTVLEATEASFDLSQRLHAAGNTTDLDLTEQRALAEQARLDLAAAETEAVARREHLTTLMGLWGTDTAWGMAVRLPEPPSEDGADEDVERRAVGTSLALAAAKQDVAVAAQRLGIARPLDLFADTTGGVSAEHSTDGEWVVGPAVSVPLPLFSQGQAAVLAARSDLRRAEAIFYATAVEVRSHARLAAARVRWARDRVTYLFTTMLPLRQTIVDRLQEQYNGMLASPFRLLQAKQQQIDAGAQYVEALGRYWSARATLDQILIGGAPPDDSTSMPSDAISRPDAHAGGH